MENKLIRYFYPSQKGSYFETLKAKFFILLNFVIIGVAILSIIVELLTPGKNLIISILSKIVMLLFLISSLFILKKKGIKIAGNIYSVTIIVILLLSINILTVNISPIYKYIQGFYSILASLIVGILFASRTIILINAILIFATTTRVYIFTKEHYLENADFFTTGYITHTTALLFITVIIYFASKFTDKAIEKANKKTRTLEEQNRQLTVNKEETRAERLFNDRLLETLPGIFFLYELTNKGAKLIKWNKNHETLLGYTKEELQMMYANDFFHSNELSRLNEKLAIVSENQEAAIELDIKHKKGHTIPYFLKALGFHDNNKQYFLGIGLNISNLKKAERDLKKQNYEYLVLNEELTASEEEVRATNEELVATSNALKENNEMLIVAKEKAEESDQLKTEFFHNMSHEVRTPLNGILGFSGLLCKPNLSEEEQIQYAQIIQSSGNQLLQIINDILEMSKLEKQQAKIVKNEIVLNDLLSEQFSEFEAQAKRQKIPLYLKKELSDEKSRIVVDYSKLSKIIAKLLENALKFTSERFIEFGYAIVETIPELSLRKQELSLQIYVKDTGIGIDLKNQKKIFDRFSQVEKELSEKVGGLGLGLSIAKENTKLLGGKITLESEKGKGATFFVTIPYNPANSDSENNNLENNNSK